MNRTGSRLFRSGQMYREQEHREEKMNIGKAVAIFRDIFRPGLTDIERGEAIKKVLDMETHNGITKAEMLQVIRYLWNMVYEEEDKK